MLIVIALGGNALQRRGAAPSSENQLAAVRSACRMIAPLARQHRLVITHGNGPQIGLLALQTAGADGAAAQPFDALGAATEGMIGYLIERELRNALPPDHLVSTLVTLVAVAPDDPAFTEPTKPIGPVYTESVAHELAARYGWTVAPDAEWWRRVVPSPIPQKILAVDTVRALLDAGAIVVCTGGGGVPVVDDGSALRGVEAVIDKDLASALLAEDLQADRLILATDVSGVYQGWSTAQQRLISHAGPDSIEASDFAAGSMRPKVEAAIRSARRGADTTIGRLQDLEELVTGGAGTVISRRFAGIDTY